MDSTDKAVTYCLISAFILITTGALGGCHELETTNRTAIQAGLIQKQNAGSAALVWSKP